MDTLVALSTFTSLCNHHHYSFPELLHDPPTEALCLLNNNCPFLPSKTPRTSILLCLYGFQIETFVFKYFKYVESHCICPFVSRYLAYFTYLNVFKVYSCCSICQNFFFHDWIIFYHMVIPHFVYLLIDTWLSSTPPPTLAIVNNVAVNIQVSLEFLFSSFGSVPRRGIAG